MVSDVDPRVHGQSDHVIPTLNRDQYASPLACSTLVTVLATVLDNPQTLALISIPTRISEGLILDVFVIGLTLQA